MKVYDLEARNVKGENVSLKDFEGQVLLIVNTATECGFTPQYDDLQDLYEKYQSQGFAVLEFPCNQFDNQAPGSDEEIASFCDAKFHLKYPRFAKIEVNGENAHPLYQFLQSKKGFEGFHPEHKLTPILESMLERKHPGYQDQPDIKWNFTKFLIDRSGEVIARFEPTENMGYVEERIKELL